MKKILLIAGVFLGIFTASAQGTLGEGNTQLNAGLGFSGWGVPVYIGLDYGINDDVTVGGEASFRSYTDSYIKHTGIGISANANYHFNRIFRLPSEFDLYGGASLGVYFWNSRWEAGYSGNLSKNSPLYFGLQIGGRYFFNDQLGLNLELGGGSTAGGKIGITYKF